jgi:uncharacterized LabA/DUF88 family protein
MSPFGIRPDERVAVFIDGPNLYAAAKQAQVEIDYKKMREHFETSSQFIRAYYYTAMADDEEEFNPVRPLLDFLGYNGFSLVTKPMKQFTDETGRKRNKGNMDIEIAVDMLGLADRLDHIILFSGNGDFRRVTEAVQDKGVRVTAVSTKDGGSTMIADELRRQVDSFVDVKDLAGILGRAPRAVTRD